VLSNCEAVAQQYPAATSPRHSCFYVSPLCLTSQLPGSIRTLTDQTDIAREPAGPSSDKQRVLAALRAATSQQHELTHQLMPLSVNTVSRGDYVAHLGILREWLGQLEAWLQRFSDGPQAAHVVSPVNRLALIEADLSHPCVTAQERIAVPPANEYPNSEQPNWRSRSESAAYRWGVCYVIEGSQLGGAVLYDRLKERLAPHPLNYLALGRGAPGKRWPAFIQAMCAGLDTEAKIQEACRGASDAFAHLIELVPCSALACGKNAD